MTPRQVRDLYFDRPRKHRIYIRRLPLRRRGITRLDLEAALLVHMTMSITNYYARRRDELPEEQR